MAGKTTLLLLVALCVVLIDVGVSNPVIGKKYGKYSPSIISFFGYFYLPKLSTNSLNHLMFKCHKSTRKQFANHVMD